MHMPLVVTSAWLVWPNMLATVQNNLETQHGQLTLTSSAFASPVSIRPEPYSFSMCFSFLSSVRKKFKYFHVTSTARLQPAETTTWSLTSPEIYALPALAFSFQVASIVHRTQSMTIERAQKMDGQTQRCILHSTTYGRWTFKSRCRLQIAFLNGKQRF